MIRCKLGRVTFVAMTIRDKRHERREHIPVRDQAGLHHHEQLAQREVPRLDAQDACVNEDQPLVVGSGSF